MKHLLQWVVVITLAGFALQWTVSVVRASAVVLLVSVGVFVLVRSWLDRRNRW